VKLKITLVISVPVMNLADYEASTIQEAAEHQMDYFTSGSESLADLFDNYPPESIHVQGVEE
jgi:hypothetical protein